MRLQVLIATYGVNGLRRTASMSLPVIDGVSYLVSCQTGEDAAPPVPQGLQRPDIRVIMTPGRGLCANRNRLLEAADAEYVLTADDDMSYTEAQLRAALNSLGEADITAFRIEGAGNKPYPASPINLGQGTPRGYCPSSVEIALRMDAIRRSGLHFCTLFGIGAPVLGCGEEDILIWNARRLGLRIEYKPIVIGRHTGGPSTGQRTPTPAVWRARGAVLRLTHPYSGWMRIVRQAMRARSFAALRMMAAGAVYAVRHRGQIEL